ncbi:MAG TPA: hypothetical protein VFL04_05225 [Rectinemataceae bacterium]|nr:hypothetical protein [Rectinemataceae bacterium]
MDDRGLSPRDFLDLDRSLAAGIFAGIAYPWEAIPRIAGLVSALIAAPPPGYALIAPGLLVAEGCSVSKRSEIIGPAIIGPGCEIRAGALIRENVILGAGCLVGNSSELKNCILFDSALAPHFNYIGDSILGTSAHLGAGVILSNFRSDHGEVKVHLGDGSTIGTGLQKLGAIVGDRAEIGCNSVCFPGSLVGRDSIVYPLCPVRGHVPARVLLRAEGLHEPRRGLPGQG